MNHWDDPSIPYAHKWALDIDIFPEDEAFDSLSPAGKEFIIDFHRELKKRDVRDSDRDTGVKLGPVGPTRQQQLGIRRCARR